MNISKRKSKIKFNSKKQRIKKKTTNQRPFLNDKNNKIQKQKKNSIPLKEKKQINGINFRINNFFNELNLKKLAKKTGYLIRESPITPFIFLYALSLQMCGIQQSLDLLAININSIFGISITGSAIGSRMNNKSSMRFLRSAFCEILHIQLKYAFENTFEKVFSSIFSGIILEDSTTCELSKSLKKKFKGVGGAASKSSIKYNFVFNLCLYAVIAIDVYSGSTPDRKNHKESLKYIKKGMLLIRDLGYFAVESLIIISSKDAYYLSRVPKGSLLYLNEDDEEPLNISKFFKKMTNRNQSGVISIFIGAKQRFQTTLILQKVPKWVLNQRIKKFKQKNSGKSPSENFIVWSGYSVYITNISHELLSTKDRSFKDLIMNIYKIRWEIELIFKKIKTNLILGDLNVKREERALCRIYGKFIAILLSMMVLSYAASQKYEGREISLAKVMAWLVSENRLGKAIFTKKFSKLYSDLRKVIKLLSKDKRNRETSLEQLLEAMKKNLHAA